MFPGVDIGEQSVRVYPDGALAAHELGYIRPINAEQLKSPTYKGYSATELIGQAGLEEQYDRLLRGTPSSKTVSVNAAGDVIGTVSQVQPVPGQTLVTNIDGALQQAVENELEQGIKLAQGNGKLGTTASAVVVDTTNGAVLAMASAPSFDPNVFVGNLSDAAYAQLSDPNASNPLISRAFSAAYAPGSTFKGSSATAILANGLTTATARTACPAQYTIPDSTPPTSFSNFEGEASGPLTIGEALERSCDTYFYSYAYQQWIADGGLRGDAAHQAKPANEIFSTTAKSFGYGSKTGVDLPNESAGILYDRAGLQKYWEATKADFCKGAETYKVSDPERARIDSAQCTSGYQLQAGEAVDFAIGQAAQVLVTPLQQAMAYAAIANGGTVYEPQIARAFLNPDGSVASVVQPKVKGKLTQAEINVLPTVMKGLQLVVSGPVGTANKAGFDTQLNVAGKTGTADVAAAGQPLADQPQSWFASVQPADNPRYAVVVMVEHGGQGADVAAKVTANIYKDIYGLDGHAPVFPNGVRPTTLPAVSPTGAITAPQTGILPITPQAPLAPGTPDPVAVKNAQDELAAAAAKAASTPAAGAS